MLDFAFFRSHGKQHARTDSSQNGEYRKTTTNSLIHQKRIQIISLFFFLLLLNQIRILIRCCRDAKKTVSLPTEEVCVLYECVFFFLNNIGGTGRKRDACKVARGRIFCREWIEKDVPTCGLFNNIYDSSVRKGHIWQIFLGSCC